MEIKLAGHRPTQGTPAPYVELPLSTSPAYWHKSRWELPKPQGLLQLLPEQTSSRRRLLEPAILDVVTLLRQVVVRDDLPAIS